MLASYHDKPTNQKLIFLSPNPQFRGHEPHMPERCVARISSSTRPRDGKSSKTIAQPSEIVSARRLG